MLIFASPVSYKSCFSVCWLNSRWLKTYWKSCLLLTFCPFPLLCVTAVEEVKLKDTQYTLEHMRAFGMYNYLHLDPWYEDSVLFVDCKGRVLGLSVTLVSFLNPFLESPSCWRPPEMFVVHQHVGVRVCACLLLVSRQDVPVGLIVIVKKREEVIILML